MTKNIITIILIFCVTNKVLADDNRYKVSIINEKYKIEDLTPVQVEESVRNPGEFGEKQIYLNKDIPAPFSGILLNPEAMAYIISDKDATKLRYENILVTQRMSDLAKLNLETSKLELQVETIQKTSIIELQNKDKELEHLKKINEDIVKDKSSIMKKIYIGLSSGAAGLIAGFLTAHYLLK